MQSFIIHPKNPQQRLIQQIAQRLHEGQIGALPTDSGYVLVSALENTSARQRILHIRGLDDDHFFTLLCHNLEHLSTYAKVSNTNFKLIKSLIPGPYTFILPSTKEVPKKLSHPKRQTIGIRVPQTPLIQHLVRELGDPVMSISLALRELTKDDANSFQQVAELVDKKVDFFVESGDMVSGETTIIDCCQQVPEVIRQGLGVL